VALLKRARHYGSLRANKSWKGYEGQLNWRYTGATTDYPSERLPGYQLVDLRVARKLSPAVRVSLKIDNLLDKTYQNTYAYNAPGRSVFLSLTWRQAKRNGS
jgi:vitamin B12 transporter